MACGGYQRPGMMGRGADGMMDPMFAMPDDAKRKVWHGTMNGGGGDLGWESAGDKHVVSFHMPA